MTAILLAAALVTAAVFCVALTRGCRASFNERFPPISDAEFLARCTPGTRPEVALKVRRIVAEHLAVEYERVYPSTRFIEDLGAD
ncbi:MAG: hypothetical protein K2X82_12870 [Gemmataceae bacterium]|nr:hypothetical protein [Gemmataceae bacterium]